MIFFYKKKKYLEIISYEYMIHVYRGHKLSCADTNSNFIEFNKEELELFKKCNFLKYNITNKKIITNIPTNIIKINFNYLDQDIQPFLHSEIKMLDFGFDYNYPVDNLPSKLEFLRLGPNFNHPINNLPTSIKTIILSGTMFNYTVDLLPESLETLVLPGNYNQPLNCLPSNLKILRINTKEFNQSINSLPDSIEILHLNNNYNVDIDKLPKKLKTFQIDLVIYNYEKDKEEIKKHLDAKIK
jgi:hypothetical protein